MASSSGSTAPSSESDTVPDALCASSARTEGCTASSLLPMSPTVRHCAGSTRSHRSGMSGWLAKATRMRNADIAARSTFTTSSSVHVCAAAGQNSCSQHVCSRWHITSTKQQYKHVPSRELCKMKNANAIDASVLHTATTKHQARLASTLCKRKPSLKPRARSSNPS